GTASCVNSVCQIACNAGFANCDNNAGNGCEIELTSDPLHCGACPTVCPSNHGSPACANSTCSIAYSAGFGNCDGLLSNGCEAQLPNDVTHCGTCSTVCTANNGVPSCINSACQISCNGGFANCDGNAANGCET